MEECKCEDYHGFNEEFRCKACGLIAFVQSEAPNSMPYTAEYPSLPEDM